MLAVVEMWILGVDAGSHLSVRYVTVHFDQILVAIAVVWFWKPLGECGVEKWKVSVGSRRR
jgi:hypothetical protein